MGYGAQYLLVGIWIDHIIFILVSNYGIAYASIDGRGTGFQSDDFTFELYKKLGTVEMEVSCNQNWAQIQIQITNRHIKNNATLNKLTQFLTGSNRSDRWYVERFDLHRF